MAASTTVMVWLARLGAMRRYVDEAPHRLTVEDLHAVASAAHDLIMRIDKELEARTTSK